MRLHFKIPCRPPATTAQTKRLAMVGGKPRFFHSAELKREEETWAALLQEHRPMVPYTGPLSLRVVLIYPHLKATAKKYQPLLIPKTTKPDAGNAAKHLEDMLSRLRFIEDDAQIFRLEVEKYHGPEAEVGIYLTISDVE